MGFLEFIMKLDIEYYLEAKNMISFRYLVSVKNGITYVISHKQCLFIVL